MEVSAAIQFLSALLPLATNVIDGFTGRTAATDKVNTYLPVLSTLFSQVASIGAIISKAQAEGRDKLTEAEWQTIIEADNSARTVLAEAINAAS